MGTIRIKQTRLLYLVFIFYFVLIFNLIANDIVDKEGNSDEIFFDGIWFSKEAGELERRVDNVEDDTASMDFSSSHKAMLYCMRERAKFRPKRDEFERGKLSMVVKADTDGKEPVSCVIFLKNTDGLWYQSRRIYSLEPGKSHELSVLLDSFSLELQGEGHRSVWNCLDAATIIAVGVNVFDKLNRPMKLSCSRPVLSGRKPVQPLKILSLNYPEKGETNSVIEGRFELSREYFNPFDPEEIAIDVEIIEPNFKEIIRPAFFARDYERWLEHNREKRVPVGRPYWAFRFTPEVAGVYKFRIKVKDSTPGFESEISSNWRTIEVEKSTRRGFVRLSDKDWRYFEFSTGEFFYPIGFNIHSVKDLRAEEALKIGYRPDRGTFSYEEYFDSMSKNKLNAVEIWMAAWSFAIEWTSSRTDYYGLGRYNLFNAWRLDHVLNYALSKGIYVHLVLDNHGKLSSHCDPEWEDSPHNKHREFAYADGAMLDRPIDFFTNEEAKKYYKKRNRYIAARWGVHPQIFGIEFWSEIDLITDISRVYHDDSSVKWHVEMSEHLKELGVKNLLTTHTCGDYNHTITYRKYYEQVPLISYIVGDAYRDNTPIVEHMQRHTETIKVFKKPFMVTEYGGTPHAATFEKLEADLHGGIWSSFFLEHCGTPFLWWHDFIHDFDKYKHFKGFAEFISDIDPRGKGFVYRQSDLYSENGIDTGEYDFLEMGNTNERYGWIFRKKYMYEYPSDLEKAEETAGIYVQLVDLLPDSEFRIEFFDTLSGERIKADKAYSDRDGKLRLNIPIFKVDISFKIRSSEE